MFASARDISERVRLEQRLREQQKYLRGLIEASIDGLVTVDPDLVVTDVNERICRMTGRSRDELIGSRFDRYFTDPAAAAAGVDRTLRDGSVADYELELVAGGGEPAVVSFNAARFTDPAGAAQGVFAAAREVTERKRAEAALAQASERERVRAERAAITSGPTPILGRPERARRRFSAARPIPSTSWLPSPRSPKSWPRWILSPAVSWTA